PGHWCGCRGGRALAAAGRRTVRRGDRVGADCRKRWSLRPGLTRVCEITLESVFVVSIVIPVIVAATGGFADGFALGFEGRAELPLWRLPFAAGLPFFGLGRLRR